jgi:hypothetical protein
MRSSVELAGLVNIERVGVEIEGSQMHRPTLHSPHTCDSRSLLDRRGFVFGAGAAGMALGTGLGVGYTQVANAPDYKLQIAPPCLRQPFAGLSRRRKGAVAKCRRCSYKYRIEPNRSQGAALVDMLRDFCSLYNAGLEQRIDAYQRRGISVTSRMQADELKAVGCAAPELTRLVVAAVVGHHNAMTQARIDGAPNHLIFQAENSPGMVGVSCVVAFHALDNNHALNKQEGGASSVGYRRQSPRRDSYGPHDLSVSDLKEISRHPEAKNRSNQLIRKKCFR